MGAGEEDAVPGDFVLDLGLQLLPGEANVVQANYSITAVASHGPGTISTVLDAGLTTVSGDAPSGTLPAVSVSENAVVPATTGRFAVRVAGSGVHDVGIRLDAPGADGVLERHFLHRTFYLDGSGLHVGFPEEYHGSPDNVTVTAGAVPSSDTQSVLESTSSCTVRFNVQFVMPSNYPSNTGLSWNQPLVGLHVHIVDSAGNVVSPVAYTDQNGRAYFTITRDPCDTNFRFYYAASYGTGSASVVTSDLSNALYQKTATPSRAIQDLDAWVVTLAPESYSAGFWIHSRAVTSQQVASAARPLNAYLELHFTPGAARRDLFNWAACDTCYEAADAFQNAEIWITGSDGFGREWDDWTVEHEFGHHVNQIWAGSLPANAYGVHYGCTSACHPWGGVHDTASSAFKEAWADFFSAVVKNGPSTNNYHMESPNDLLGDGNSYACLGGFRECSVAASLWKIYKTPGVTLAMMGDVLSRGPQDIYHYQSTWVGYPKPYVVDVDNALIGMGIAPYGDANLGSDAPNSGSVPAVITPARGVYGDLSMDDHINSADKADLFALQANAGDIVRAYVSPVNGQNVDVYLFDPSGNQVRSGVRTGGVGDAVEYPVASSGYGGPGQWRIEVRNVGSAQGAYEGDFTVGQKSWSAEAETFSTRTTGGIAANSAASGGQEWNLWSNGYVSTGTSTMPVGWAKLAVMARGDPAGGIWPIMKIYVDNALVVQETVSTSSLHTYDNYVYLSGTTSHTVKVEFTNDAIVGTEDRNLRVDNAVLTAVDDAYGGEAENFATRTTGGLDTDGAASNGKAWNLWSNGYIQDNIWTDWNGPHELAFRVRGDPAGGVWPHMKVTLGTTVVMDSDVYCQQWCTYTAQTQSLSPNLYNLKVEFTNDGIVGTEDRNLHVDRVDLYDLPG